jgi:hypothetical protein
MARVGLEAQDLEQRQREPGGLAGAGLGSAKKVFAGEYDGDGLSLDGGRCGVALLGDSLEQFGRKPEGVKGTNEKSPALGLLEGGSLRPVQADASSLLLVGPGWPAYNGLKR